MTDVWRWYTKARRFPALIGKDASGRRIPGGPYTVLQVIAVPVAAALLWNTQGLWGATMSGLARVIIVVAGTLGAVKLLGKVDFASRNPIYLTTAYALQAFGSLGGHLGQTWVRPQRLSRVRSSIAIATSIATTTAGAVDTASPRSVLEAEFAVPSASATQPRPAERAPMENAAPAAAPTTAAASSSTSQAARRSARSGRARNTATLTPTSQHVTTPTATDPASTVPTPARSAPSTATTTTAAQAQPRRTGLEAFLASSSQKDAA